ncbi:DUF6313 family protein [Streptomyces sp. NPDC050273]|uniref:DUF6313 family protein n=1 Tax=Streptomyces sp. NPDC050273 TaxID=3154933 RepID=UPI00342A8D54
MLIDALPILIVLAGVLLIGGWLLGWRVTYEVLALNTSPYGQSVKNRAAGWLIWLTGWLAVPSVIGALAGEAIGHVVERRQAGTTPKQAVGEMREELGEAQQPPQLPPLTPPQPPPPMPPQQPPDPGSASGADNE